MSPEKFIGNKSSALTAEGRKVTASKGDVGFYWVLTMPEEEALIQRRLPGREMAVGINSPVGRRFKNPTRKKAGRRPSVTAATRRGGKGAGKEMLAGG